MKQPLVSIIIVNWNGEEVIKSCLVALEKITYTNKEVIVVDNNSSDQSTKTIAKFPKVKLIHSKENLGFAGGNNLGLTYASGEFILLLNSDTVVTENFLSELISSLQKDEKLGVVQPKIVFKDEASRSPLINSIGADFTTTGFLYYLGYRKKANDDKYNHDAYIFSAYGACMLIRKKVIEEVGLFDEKFFMYFEETDFCMRVWLAGWKIKYISNVTIFHEGGVSSKKFGVDKIYFHSFKNRICTYIKNLEIYSLLKTLPIHLVLCEIGAFGYLFTGKPSYFLAVQKAIIWNIFNLSETLYKRDTVIKQMKKIKEDKYLSEVTATPRLVYYLYLFLGLEYYKE